MTPTVHGKTTHATGVVDGDILPNKEILVRFLLILNCCNHPGAPGVAAAYYVSTRSYLVSTNTSL